MGQEPSGESLSHQSLAELFYEWVQEAGRRRKIQSSAHSQHYLVNLLIRFAAADGPHPLAEHGERYAALSERFHACLNLTGEQRSAGLRELGDVALYVAGYFPDSLQRRLLSPDYFVQWGRSAYFALYAAWQRTGHPLLDTWSELADHLPRFVELLNEVSDVHRARTPKGILSLYDRWRRTGDDHARMILEEQGIPLKDPQS